jgi:diguanylate cyclase
VEYSDLSDKAGDFAARAIAEMKKLGVSPHPNNFALFYCHVSGTYPDLSKAIDILATNGQAFTEAACSGLHDKFLSHAIEAANLKEVSTHIEEMLAQVIEYLGNATKGNVNYGETLSGISSILADGATAQNIKAIVTEVLNETRTVISNNRELEVKLDNSASEARKLRVDLEAMKRETMTDGLTGIANRRLFDIMIRESAMEAMENGTNLCLAMLDIDHFKRFNDTYGHQTGDQVLALVARTITDCIKGQDKAARYGGEEFAVILPATTIDQAVSAIDNIRRTLNDKQVTNKRTGKNLGQVSLSGGVAVYRFGEPLGQWIHRADEALYAAKRAGRNMVVSAAGK